MQLPRQDLTDLFVEPGCDWSSKTIIAALERKGLAPADIEAQLGLGYNSIRNVFYREVPRYQEAIAQAIGIDAAIIWPSRYRSDVRKSA